MNDIAANEERLRVLKWLSPLAFGPRLTDMLDRRQEGTGTWLLESQLFTAWINGDVRTIWCPGMREYTCCDPLVLRTDCVVAGAGKTILA